MVRHIPNPYWRCRIMSWPMCAGSGAIMCVLRCVARMESASTPSLSGEGDLGRFLFNNLGQSVHVAGNLSLNHWNGSVTPQIQILDAALPV